VQINVLPKDNTQKHKYTNGNHIKKQWVFTKVTQNNNLCTKTLINRMKHIKKEMGEKPLKTPSLRKLSPTTTAHFNMVIA
jgi:hypothetical protein